MSGFENEIEELLNVCAPWEAVSVTKREQAEGLGCGVVTIELAIRKEQLVPCPKCGRMCKRHDRKWREWRTQLRAAVPRANCPEHGVHQIDMPWAGRRCLASWSARWHTGWRAANDAIRSALAWTRPRSRSGTRM